VISINRNGKYFFIRIDYQRALEASDIKFYLFTRQNIPSTINDSSLSITLQKCSLRRLLSFCLVIPIFTRNYGFLVEIQSLQPKILGKRTSWQAEGFFNLQILQARGQKLIRKRAWKSWNFPSKTRECTLTRSFIAQTLHS